tara:strand:+ start:1196 stop:2854 length:1659 start_codon:yes stop_codon:yes gene_type:complete
MNYLHKIVMAFIGISILGCSDYHLSQKIELAPEIEVIPHEHNFGALNADGETSTIEVTISNVGTDDLSLFDIYLKGGSSNFSITTVGNAELQPAESTSLIVTYDPGTYENNSDILSIWSNDEDEEEVEVTLNGSGDAPIITVNPDYHDFGTVYLGCDDSIEITVGNIGNADLILSDLEYFASLPVDFSLENYEDNYGLLPITIPSGDSIQLNVDYMPLDILDDAAYIEIVSNDPANPTVYADHDGLGDFEAWITDTFSQDGNAIVDILFVIDNSGSMSSNQTNLKNNFGDFMSVFVLASVDYQVALITTDDASFVGNIITPSTPDPVTEFSNQVDTIGWHGAPIEKGLWYSYESTSSGGDASPGSTTGFFRASARLVVVYVSDEPDASTNTSAYGGGSASMTPADYSTHLQSLKSSPELVVAHAVAGDYPSGCTTNGSAQFGDGYYDVVNNLGGTFMSICAEDWSVTMDTLARDSMALSSFNLTGDPIEDTIEITVDGVLDTSWTYDNILNAVMFTAAPPDQSAIEVTYAIWAVCDTVDPPVSDLQTCKGKL